MSKEFYVVTYDLLQPFQEKKLHLRFSESLSQWKIKKANVLIN
jgi:hypothetical protein